MAVSPRMKAAIVLYVRVGGNRHAFIEAATAIQGLTEAGAATYYHVLRKCPTPAHKTYMAVERMKHRGVLKA